ncbi:KDO2-lipid IV(A) lauroyltransferase [Marinobacterium mangrovicola]|uniref:KDO2-lipid IV(A) lauroyltransferase n=2 Tax=Marinobacterium mangrovicola TaxID=1476959 RepID=A0A4R1GAC6_9GAMM|nr:KDO2-lipid IV(A) lauroyltransferase [Marinobacterium mangrovicola]
MRLVALLPLSMAQWLGRCMGRWIYRQGDKQRLYTNTRINLELCFPEMPKAERDKLTKKSLENTGCSLAEMGVSWIWSPERVLEKVKSVVGEDLIADELNNGRGILLIAPHLGNWEVMNLYLSRRYPVTAMYKPPRQKKFDELILKRRARLGSKMAPADTRGVRMLIKALRGGEIVGVLPDQEPDREGGVFVPFFGQPALTMKLFPQLAAQTGVTVISGYAKRLENGEGFELRFAKAEAEINNKDVQISAAAMNRSIEHCVNECPEQYQWEYKRFHSREDGSDNPYRLPYRLPRR